MNASEWIQLGLSISGFIAIAYGVACLGERFFGDGVARSEPKPRPYRVTIEDPDGWPYRNYCVSVKDAARVVRDLERLKNG